MSYQVPYVAEYECPKGHRFKAYASPMKNDSEIICRTCYNEWVAANVYKAKQVTRSIRDDKPRVVPL